MFSLPKDKLLPFQWHLSGANGANVLSAWQAADGRGVRVAVVDDGVQASHHDLASALRPSLSVDLTGGEARTGVHGTLVAGVLASAANGQGTVGVAPAAELGDIRISYVSGSATQYAEALSRSSAFDISNNSWSFVRPYADDPSLPTMAPLFDALSDSALGGRAGLGTVFVFAAGNNRLTGDATSYHGLQSSPYVITVGAYGPSLGVSSFSNPGSSLLISAPGEGIWTTSQTGGNAVADGTSFAAPVVSGIVALMLDAQPRLGARDVSEILALSAALLDGPSGSVTNGADDWNGGGHRFSNDAGFGRADGAAALRLAEAWFATPATKPGTYGDWTSISASAAGGTLAEVGRGAPREITFSLSGSLRVEKVTLDLGMDAAIAMSMDLVLVSPDGTESRLTRGASPHASVAGAAPADGTWTFLSNAFLGEAAEGTWRLRGSDLLVDGITGAIRDLRLTVLGEVVGVDDRYVYTDDFARLARQQPGRVLLVEADGGNDTLDLSPTSFASSIDLAGVSQDLGGMTLTVRGSLENALGGGGADRIAGSEGGNVLWGGWGADSLYGRGGDDTLRGGSGNDLIDGGLGADLLLFGGRLSDYAIGSVGETIVLRGPDGTDLFTGCEFVQWSDGALLSTAEILARASAPVAAVNRGGEARYEIMDFYTGPVSGITAQYLGSSTGEVVRATVSSTFINLLGGDDAALGSSKADVIDGGTGSNFLTGAGGLDVFFVDGRSGGATWSTIADWEEGEQLSVWGWRPGISRTEWSWGGAAGYEGATLHLDLDGNRVADVSVTWTGQGQGAIKAPVEFDGLLWFL